MKKILLFLLLFIPINVYAEKTEVKLSSCIDGDTAKFILSGEIIKARFLAIDTPESVSTKVEDELYGKEASIYTCNKLKNSIKIEIEYDSNSDKLDKYNRHLVWIFVDNKLLQEDLVRNGYAEVAYIYGDYKYLNILEKNQKLAQKENLNIWNNYDNSYNIYYLILISILVIIICILSKKHRNKIVKYIIKSLKK